MPGWCCQSQERMVSSALAQRWARPGMAIRDPPANSYAFGIFEDALGSYDFISTSSEGIVKIRDYSIYMYLHRWRHLCLWFCRLHEIKCTCPKLHVLCIHATLLAECARLRVFNIESCHAGTTCIYQHLQVPASNIRNIELPTPIGAV